MTYEINVCNDQDIIQDIAEVIVFENQDYVEDRLISLCDDIANDDVSIAEIASGLLFTLHYILCKQGSEEAKKYYSFLLNQCRQQIEAMNEFYEFS